MKTAIIVDDSRYMREIIGLILRENNIEVIAEAETGAEGLALIREHQPDLVTLDNMLPDSLGLHLLELLKNKFYGKVIMITSAGHQQLKEEAAYLGAAGYLVKPFTREEINHLLQEINSTKIEPHDDNK